MPGIKSLPSITWAGSMGMISAGRTLLLDRCGTPIRTYDAKLRKSHDYAWDDFVNQVCARSQNFPF